MALIKKLKKAKKATRMGAKFAVGTGKFLESAGYTGTGRKIAAGEEYMIATVLLAQEIKVMRQRRRIAQLETAITKLRESAVLTYEQMLAQDT